MKLTLFSPFWGDVGPQMFSKLHASASCKTRVITLQETISLYSVDSKRKEKSRKKSMKTSKRPAEKLTLVINIYMNNISQLTSFI